MTILLGPIPGTGIRARRIDVPPREPRSHVTVHVLGELCEAPIRWYRAPIVLQRAGGPLFDWETDAFLA